MVSLAFCTLARMGLSLGLLVEHAACGRGTQFMTQSSQLIALLTSMGWKRVRRHHTLVPSHAWLRPDMDTPQLAPELTLDLMASAEATLNVIEAADYYGIHLPKAAGSGLMSMRWQQTERLASATKKQRLEAYLRVTGRWVDQPHA